jgi:hypothetical protein
VRAFLARRWSMTLIGPYAVVTVELAGRRHLTSVTWGEGGMEVARYGARPCRGAEAASAAHEALCARIEAETGLVRRAQGRPPAA